MTLARLLRPLTIREAIAAFDDGGVRHLPGDEDPRRFAGLMDWDVATQVIQQHAGDATELRVLKNGVRVPVEMLKRDRAATPAGGATLRQLVRQGVSLVMGDVAACTPALQQLAYEVERWFACPLTLGMIATFGEGRALKPHYDDEDIVALQVAGEKTWKIMAGPSALPYVRGRDVEPEEVACEIRMRPGDALLVPHGTWHSCWGEADSLQLSILLSRRRGVDLLDRLARLGRGDPELWRAAPLTRDAARTAAFEARWKARMHRLIDEAAMSDLLAEEDRSVAAPVRLDLDRNLDTADRRTIVSLAVRRPIALPADPDEALRMGDARIAATPAVRAVAAVLNQHVSLPLGDLQDRLAPEPGPDAVAAAASALSDAGFVTLHAPAPAASP